MKIKAESKSCSGHKRAATVLTIDGGEGIVSLKADVKSDEFLDADSAVITSFSHCDFDSATALQRHSEYWCRPVFCDKVSDIPDETQLLIMKTGDVVTIILPVVSENYRTVLFSDGDVLKARTFSLYGGLTQCTETIAVTGRGSDAFSLIEKCFSAAIKSTSGPALMRGDRVYPEVLEYLGWCSWDALQIRVNHAGLVEKCAEFTAKGIPVRWALIDDMWADVPAFVGAKYSDRQEMFKLMHSSALASFEAAPDRFPGGLAAAIKDMKKYVDYVGVWHPVTGYWFGIERGSKLYEQFKDILYETPDGRLIIKPDYASFYRFFDAFHAYIKSCGADFVKVDNQSIIRLFYKGCAPIGKIARDLQRAIDDSVKKHFGGAVINCMGCASDNVFSRPFSAVTRCSDDFIPEDAAWFKKHILQCSFTSMYQNALYQSDWDMWWTDDGQAEKNSLLRAISGGPIYVSDEIGRSRKKVLMPLIADDGKILRCARPAAPTPDCLFSDPVKNGKIFKVQNMPARCGAVVAFNLGDGPAEGCISAEDVTGLEGDKFAVYERFTGEIFVLTGKERRKITLSGPGEYRLYIMSPIKDDFAAIGIIDKYMSPLTVISADANHADLLCGGEYMYYLSGAFYREKRRKNT